MKTILLVEDDKQLRTLFGLALRKGGYHVIEVDSGLTGLEMARKYLPDLILSDINMPSGDGTALLRQIRRDPELKSTQFVRMTGDTGLETPCMKMEEVPDGFLLKPVSLQAFLNCVKARCNRSAGGYRI
jgi:CheY-like chemotaxis protein